ncbi:hypothetical protein JRI60_42930 [Archangium violaceum]|uniref:hypothetical protein n=1 Tax=Archangium violaceum TaxID=83451 RepID=UPI00194FE975|nr:hypothetical protein [Archangium violaceum]QRN95736.1 hypothetical protein JRI60_42930 [Archangium violaceum]
MPITSLNANFTNIQAFVDSCFNVGVRGVAALNAAIGAGQFIADFTNGESEQILDCLVATWRYAEDRKMNLFHNRCPESDRTFIHFLASYIRQRQLVLYMPLFIADGMYGGTVPRYRLMRYSTVALRANNAWDYEAVRQFLRYFLFGAHIVVVDSALTANQRLQGEFQTACAGHFKGGASNSHYASVVSTNGLAYPNTVVTDRAPNPCPFICSLLVGTTSREPYCSFFQLEGWPTTDQTTLYDAAWARQSRHMQDYDTHNRTKWNISTYGACAYSEKRGTAIFLAPANWNPRPRADAIMPSFRGAEVRQGWLNTNLVRI